MASTPTKSKEDNPEQSSQSYYKSENLNYGFFTFLPKIIVCRDKKFFFNQICEYTQHQQTGNQKPTYGHAYHPWIIDSCSPRQDSLLVQLYKYQTASVNNVNISRYILNCSIAVIIAYSPTRFSRFCEIIFGAII